MKKLILILSITGLLATAAPIKIISDSGEKTCDYTKFTTLINSAEIHLECGDDPAITPPIETPASSQYATETPETFEQDWLNLYNKNAYGTKSQMQAYIGNGYQRIDNGKEVYIINQSRNITTIIPSCTNGMEYTFNGANCKIDEPFKRNEIYSLRGRTADKSDYKGATVTKDSGQLYAGRGESYKVVVSPYPGEMDETRGGSFEGDCETTAFGYLYIGLAESGSGWSQCNIPRNTNFYINVELLDDNSKTICDSKLCQFDIKLSGTQLPDL